MSKPNRCMAYAARVQMSDYDTFPRLDMATRAARELVAQGFKVRESKFRIGKRGPAQKYQYRVSAYWNEGDARPDMGAARKAAWSVVETKEA